MFYRISDDSYKDPTSQPLNHIILSIYTDDLMLPYFFHVNQNVTYSFNLLYYTEVYSHNVREIGHVVAMHRGRVYALAGNTQLI